MKDLHFSSSTIAENFPSNLSVVDVIVLARTDYDLNNLYDNLHQYKDKVFTPHERLLITLHDIDYYPSLSGPGNTIYNLFEIISELNLSTDHIVMITNFPGIEEEIFHCCEIKNLSCPKIINFALWYTYPDISKLNKTTIKSTKKSFLYSCLNGSERFHRKTFIALLYQSNLIDKGMISYHTNCSPPWYSDLKNTKSIKNSKIHFRKTEPFTRINENLSSCKASKLLHVEYSTQLSIPIKSKEIEGDMTNSSNIDFCASFLQQSLVYIVTETVGNYPYPFVTEKTWKALVNHMPFMILGPKNNLNFLKDCGFKTFDSFWDESYDNKESCYERSKIIIDNLKYLAHQDWKNLATQMQPIVEHNFNHLFTFQANELGKLKNMLS